ncbi:TPA: hypothetical protein KMK54_004917 [Escherichia coli]|nr:hypothetical protein [Escherichia coli]
MYFVIVTNNTHAGTQTVEATRDDGYKTFSPVLYTRPPLAITNSNNYSSDTFTTSIYVKKLSNANGPFWRIELNGSSGAVQMLTPSCFPMGVSDYSHASGEYAAKCNLLVKYKNNSNYQNYDPNNKNKVIVSFAIDVTYVKNGTAIDPQSTNLPIPLTGRFTIQTFDDRIPHQTVYELYENSYRSLHTRLVLTMDDVVRAIGDDAAITYRWEAKSEVPNISAMNTKMYMEQIDSNLALSYVQPDGSGAVAIVPHSKVTIEDTSRRITSNGKIKLKLDSKTGFGTRSSRLRVTVEWQ